MANLEHARPVRAPAPHVERTVVRRRLPESKASPLPAASGVRDLPMAELLHLQRLVGNRAVAERLAPEPERSERIQGSLGAMRRAVRADLFVEATAQGLTGGPGRSSEYGAIIYTEPVPDGSGRRYAHTRAWAGGSRHMEFSEGDLIQRVRLARFAQGKPHDPSVEIVEVAHTHPAGPRAEVELGTATERLSPEDIAVGRAGSAGGIPPNLALVTPSGGYDIVGKSTGGGVVEALPRSPEDRMGRRPEFRPEGPELPETVRERIELIAEGRRAELLARLPAPTGLERRSIERGLRSLERLRARALRRLDRQVERGTL